jgi:hypothetical protein
MAVVLVLIFLWLMFPQPVPELWPPDRPNDQLWIRVLIDDYHSLITFPDYELGCFQEWHMGVANWYLHRDFDYWALFKSFFSPVPATIRFGVFTINYGLKNNISPEKTYTFYLSEKGKKHMLAYLHSWRGAEIGKKGEYWFFAAKRGWHPFSNCNAFIGGALRAAGLPIREAFSQESRTMTWQLRRCQAFQAAWQASRASLSETRIVGSSSADIHRAEPKHSADQLK